MTLLRPLQIVKLPHQNPDNSMSILLQLMLNEESNSRSAPTEGECLTGEQDKKIPTQTDRSI